MGCAGGTDRSGETLNAIFYLGNWGCIITLRLCSSKLKWDQAHCQRC